jgi:rod shape determining protein RodA
MRRVDWFLLAVTLALVALGVTQVHSATLRLGRPANWLDDLVWRQIIFTALGLVAMIVMAAIDYRRLRSAAPAIYVGMIGLLLLVFVTGEAVQGSRRWISLGGLFDLQPSEVAKIAVAIGLARLLSTRDVRKTRHMLLSMVMVVVPMVLVYKQPDLGTALVIGSIWLSMSFVAGLSLLQIGVVALGCALTIPVSLRALESYMLGRLSQFVAPELDPDASFTVIQSWIAIGNGGLRGKGYLHGTQSQLEFLRVPHTDYIFSVTAEELGFIGASSLLLMLAAVVLRALYIAHQADDRFGQLMAVGIATIILVQTWVNVGVNLRLLPVTGLPLPFISAGGSSLVSLMAGLGILHSIRLHHRPSIFA